MNDPLRAYIRTSRILQQTAADRLGGLGHGNGVRGLKATTAVHRLVVSRHERHGRNAATFRTRDTGHLAGPTARAVSATLDAAGGTALGLIQQALLHIKALLPGREHECAGAVLACQRLVFKRHRDSSLSQVLKEDPRSAPQVSPIEDEGDLMTALDLQSSNSVANKPFLPRSCQCDA
jgi:hypothetical protein